MRTRVTTAALSAVLVLALTGCTTPDPPEPTPTSAFSSEEAAFAAAEETYRAYVDAVNARRADPTGTTAPTDFLIADALEAEIDTEHLMASEGLSITGKTKVTGAQGHSWDADNGDVELNVCIDSSGTTVRDATGADVTPASRPVTYVLAVRFELVADDLLISSTRQTADATC